MVRLSESAHLKANAATVWSEIGDFDSIADWHPYVERVDARGNEPGTVRTAHAADGGRHVERLRLFDAARQVYRYEIESTPMPVSNYTGQLSVEDRGDDASVVEWSVSFDLARDADDGTVEMVQGFLRAGTESIRDRFDA